MLLSVIGDSLRLCINGCPQRVKRVIVVRAAFVVQIGELIALTANSSIAASVVGGGTSLVEPAQEDIAFASRNLVGHGNLVGIPIACRVLPELAARLRAPVLCEAARRAIRPCGTGHHQVIAEFSLLLHPLGIERCIAIGHGVLIDDFTVRLSRPTSKHPLVILASSRLFRRIQIDNITIGVLSGLLIYAVGELATIGIEGQRMFLGNIARIEHIRVIDGIDRIGGFSGVGRVSVPAIEFVSNAINALGRIVIVAIRFKPAA